MSRLKASNTVSATTTLNLRTAEAMFKVNDALFAVTQDIFAEINFTAAERAPVLPKATSEREPGELRDSIRNHVRQVKKGVKATLTTNCGYGAWVELGTAKAPAESYLWPAFEEHIGKLPEATKERLEEISG